VVQKKRHKRSHGSNHSDEFSETANRRPGANKEEGIGKRFGGTGCIKREKEGKKRGTSSQAIGTVWAKDTGGEKKIRTGQEEKRFKEKKEGELINPLYCVPAKATPIKQ